MADPRRAGALQSGTLWLVLVLAALGPSKSGQAASESSSAEAVATLSTSTASATSSASDASTQSAQSSEATSSLTTASGSSTQAPAVSAPPLDAKAQAALDLERAKAIAAHEHARLNKLAFEQSQLRGQLDHQSTRSNALHDEVTALVQEVGEAFAQSPSPNLALELERRVFGLLAQVREDLEFQLQTHSRAEAPRIEVHELPTLRVDEKKLQAMRLEIVKTSDALAQRAKTFTWNTIFVRSKDMRELNRIRLELLSKIPNTHRTTLTGFTAKGWSNILLEFQQMRLELTVRWLRFRDRLRRLGQELVQKRGEVTVLVAKLIVLLLVFRWWRSRAEGVLMSLRKALLDRRKEIPALEHARVFFWYLIKIRSPLEWWMLGWIIAHLWIPTNWLELSLLWTMYKWIVGGSVVVAWLNAFATRGISRRDRLRDGNKKLRLETLGLLGFSAMGVGLALELAHLLVGQGVVYRWIVQGAWWLCLPIGVYLLVRWRPVVLARCEQRSHQSSLARWVHEQRGGLSGILGVVLGALYLLTQGAWQRASVLLMQLDLFRRASAFLHRRDAEQKSELGDEPEDRIFAAAAASPQFDPDRMTSALLEIGPPTHISKMAAWLEEGRHSLIAVVGERGSGKSSFLARLAQDEAQAIYNHVIDCPKSGLADLYTRLESELGAKIGDEEAFAARLEDERTQVICIDNLHRLVRTSIGGLAPLDEFVGFARRWNRSVTWIVGFGASAWRYTQRARGDRAYFDEVVELRPWKELEIRQLLDERCGQAKLSPDFSALRFAVNESESIAYAYQKDTPALTQEDIESSRASYYRILWDYAAGNPGVALHAWSQSLFQGSCDEAPVVRLFDQRATAQVEGLSLPALFTLRSLVQLDESTSEELIECTNLLSQDCGGAIRTLLSLGIVERMGPWYRIRWEWYRPVMTVLLRQQLLMR